MRTMSANFQPDRLRNNIFNESVSKFLVISAQLSLSGQGHNVFMVDSCYVFEIFRF